MFLFPHDAPDMFYNIIMYLRKMEKKYDDFPG